jgi:segregation and condensation protein A
MDWSPLDKYLVAYLVAPDMVATVLASSFAAALELIREGQMEAHQQGAFSPLYLRKKQNADGSPAEGPAVEPGNG